MDGKWTKKGYLILHWKSKKCSVIEKLKDKTQQRFKQALQRILARYQGVTGELIGIQCVSEHKGEATFPMRSSLDLMFLEKNNRNKRDSITVQV